VHIEDRGDVATSNEPTQRSFACRVLTEESAWDIIREDWERLYAITPGATPWQSWDFQSRWWRYMRGSRQLRIVIVTHDDTACLILPLQLTIQTAFRLRVLEPIGMPDDINRPRLGIGPFDLSALHAGLQALWNRPVEWDGLRIDEKTLPDDEVSVLREAAKSRAATIRCVPFHPCPFLTLPVSWNVYLAERGTRLAKNLRSSRRAIEARGALSSEQFDDAAGVVRAYDVLVELHRRSWKHDAKIGLSQSEHYQTFYRDFVVRMAQLGRARAWILSCDGVTVAATLAFHDKATYYSTQIAHDQAFAKASPGTLLESIELEKLISEGRFQTYDFLGGALNNKRRWTDSALQTHRAWLIRRSVRGRLFSIFTFRIKPLLKSLLKLKTVALPPSV
jgi:CelD/BcsL family acetyltransferase involved in cellulose biosynthesis